MCDIILGNSSPFFLGGGILVFVFRVCVLCSFTPFLLVLFVFHRKKHSLFESNHHIYDFNKRLIFEMQRPCRPLWTSVKWILVSADACMQQLVLICIYFCVSAYWSLIACLSVCVMPNLSTSKDHVIWVNPSVNLISCCIKHIARYCLYYDTKAQQI